MPVSFRILPRHFLIYFRYEGVMGASENIQVLRQVVAHPDFRKGMRGLIDLTEVVDWERDFLEIMRFHALETEVHDDPYRPTLVVCLAPNEHTRRLAQFINRGWEGSGRKVTVTVETEAEALSVLGHPAKNIQTMLQEA